MVEFPADGTGGVGYLAGPDEGAGLGVLVIPEWWALADHVKDVCERFAREGFTALAPALDARATTPIGEPDEAARAGMALELEQAAQDLSGAVDFLAAHQAVRGNGLGVVGFSLGGGLALWLATLRPERVRAVVPFYGLVPAERRPDWSAMEAAVEGHYAEHDELQPAERARELEQELERLGKDVRLFFYPGTSHAFFDDTRPEVYDEDAARQSWVRTLEFLRAKLG